MQNFEQKYSKKLENLKKNSQKITNFRKNINFFSKFSNFSNIFFQILQFFEYFFKILKYKIVLGVVFVEVFQFVRDFFYSEPELVEFLKFYSKNVVLKIPILNILDLNILSKTYFARLSINVRTFRFRPVFFEPACKLFEDFRKSGSSKLALVVLFALCEFSLFPENYQKLKLNIFV